jgi:hypothetical protein
MSVYPTGRAEAHEDAIHLSPYHSDLDSCITEESGPFVAELAYTTGLQVSHRRTAWEGGAIADLDTDLSR